MKLFLLRKEIIEIYDIHRVGQATDLQRLQQQNNTLQVLIHGEICQKARPVEK